MNTILALIMAIIVAIPTIWAWKKSNDAKKAKSQHKKDLEKIREAVHSDDAAAVGTVVDDLLRT